MLFVSLRDVLLCDGGPSPSDIVDFLVSCTREGVGVDEAVTREATHDLELLLALARVPVHATRVCVYFNSVGEVPSATLALPAGGGHGSSVLIQLLHCPFERTRCVAAHLLVHFLATAVRATPLTTLPRASSSSSSRVHVSARHREDSGSDLMGVAALRHGHGPAEEGRSATRKARGVDVWASLAIHLSAKNTMSSVCACIASAVCAYDVSLSSVRALFGAMCGAEPDAEVFGFAQGVDGSARRSTCAQYVATPVISGCDSPVIAARAGEVPQALPSAVRSGTRQVVVPALLETICRVLVRCEPELRAAGAVALRDLVCAPPPPAAAANCTELLAAYGWQTHVLCVLEAGDDTVADAILAFITAMHDNALTRAGGGADCVSDVAPGSTRPGWTVVRETMTHVGAMRAGAPTSRRAVACRVLADSLSVVRSVLVGRPSGAPSLEAPSPQRTQRSEQRVSLESRSVIASHPRLPATLYNLGLLVAEALAGGIYGISGDSDSMAHTACVAGDRLPSDVCAVALTFLELLLALGIAFVHFDSGAEAGASVTAVQLVATIVTDVVVLAVSPDRPVSRGDETGEPGADGADGAAAVGGGLSDPPSVRRLAACASGGVPSEDTLKDVIACLKAVVADPQFARMDSVVGTVLASCVGALGVCDAATAPFGWFTDLLHVAVAIVARHSAAILRPLPGAVSVPGAPDVAASPRPCENVARMLQQFVPAASGSVQASAWPDLVLYMFQWSCDDRARRSSVVRVRTQTAADTLSARLRTMADRTHAPFEEDRRARAAAVVLWARARAARVTADAVAESDASERSAKREWRRTLRDLSNERGPWGRGVRLSDMSPGARVERPLWRRDRYMDALGRHYRMRVHPSGTTHARASAWMHLDPAVSACGGVTTVATVADELPSSGPDVGAAVALMRDLAVVAAAGAGCASMSVEDLETPVPDERETADRVEATSRTVNEIAVSMITPLLSTPGLLTISSEGLSFCPDDATSSSASDEGSYKAGLLPPPRAFTTPAREVLCVERRRCRLMNTAIEVFTASGRAYMFDCGSSDVARRCVRGLGLGRRRNEIGVRCLCVVLFISARAARRLADATKRWENREMSNFEYLVVLNRAAGRSTCDVSQYPVFPCVLPCPPSFAHVLPDRWVLCDFESADLDLRKPSVYRCVWQYGDSRLAHDARRQGPRVADGRAE